MTKDDISDLRSLILRVTQAEKAEFMAAQEAMLARRNLEAFLERQAQAPQKS